MAAQIRPTQERAQSFQSGPVTSVFLYIFIQGQSLGGEELTRSVTLGPVQFWYLDPRISQAQPPL